MPFSSISLCVYGGSLEGGLNPTPIVSVGEASGKFTPFTPALVTEDRSWSITHGQDYTAYTLHTKEYSFSDGHPGQLLVCLLLPPTHLLANGASPLEILNAALDLFHGTVPISPIDDGEFSILLDRYTPLVERASLLPVMNGLSVAAFIPKDMNQLSALMRYSRYPVLEAVKRLELGMNCEPTITLPVPSGKPKASQAPQAPPSPAPQKTINKTKVIKRKTYDDDAAQTEGRDTKPMYTADGKRTPVNTTGTKKNGFMKAALITGAAAVAAALLFFLWPKDKETKEDKPLTEQTSPKENIEQPNQEVVSEETTMEEEVVDTPSEEIVNEEKPKDNAVNLPENQTAKEKETPKRNEGGKTTDVNEAPPKTTPQMSKATAIGILLDGRGDMTAARNALSQQERNDIEVIRALSVQISQVKRAQANQVLSQLRTGKISIADAKSQLGKIAKNTTPQMSRKDALEIVLGDRKNGDINAAYSVFTPQERNDIQAINSLRAKASKRKQRSRIQKIIDSIMLGGSIAAAREQIEKIINEK